MTYTYIFLKSGGITVQSNKMKTILLSSALVLGVMMPGIAMSEELTLDKAVARGVASNPEYGVVANNKSATEQELRQAKGLRLPSVDMTASAGYSIEEDATTRAAGEDHDTKGIYSTQVTLTQMLFDGWAASSEINRQKSRVLSAAARVAETQQLTGMNIVESYLEVMRQRDLLQIAKDNVQDHMSMLSEIRTGTQAGRSTEADVSQADARLAASRANEADVRQALRNAESLFIRYTGEEADILVMPAVPNDKLQETVDEAVKVAVTETPTLAIYEADTNVAWEEYQAAKAPFYPRVDLQLAGRQDNDISSTGNDKSASAQVVARWNLYRGGIDTAVKRENTYRHAQAKEQRALVSRQIEDEIRQTWAAMVAAGERAKEYNEQANANERVVTAYKDQFELDRRTLLDVLDAQNELFVSRSNAVNAQYLEMLAVYRVLALQGRLLPTLGVTIPGDATVASAQ